MNEMHTTEHDSDTGQTPVSSQSDPQLEQSQASSEALTKTEVDSLLQQLAEEAKKRKKKLQGLRILGICYGVLVVSILILSLVEHTRGMFGVFRLLSFTGIIAGIGAASKVQKEGVRKLAKSPDIRGVGHFIEALDFGDKEIRAEAVDALMGQLPRLKASDSRLLNDDQRAVLYKQLRGKNTKLILAILESLEQIGDAKAIPPVESLAGNAGSESRDSQIAASAKACLPALRLRAEQERASQTLLRPTTNEGAESEILLRPMANAQDTPAEQLLRAANPDSSAS